MNTPNPASYRDDEVITKLFERWTSQRETNPGFKITEQHTSAKPAPFTYAAAIFLPNYSGDFEFVLDLKRKFIEARNVNPEVDGSIFTPRQLAGIANCLMADIAYYRKLQAKASKAQTPTETFSDSYQAQIPARRVEASIIALEGVKIVEGTFTVSFPNGGYKTILIEKNRVGKVLASYLNGPDNTRNFKPFAEVSADGFTLFGSFNASKGEETVSALKTVLTGNAQEYGTAYAQRSGICWRCGRKLTTPESISAGIGPICAGKL